MFFILLLIVLPQFSLGTDKLYLKCDPEENCVVQRIGPITVENPACVTRRALCRIKCRQLNEDADDYIRSDQSKIDLIDQQLIQLQNQLSNSILRQSTYQSQLSEFKLQFELLKKTNLTMSEQLQIYLDSMKSLKHKLKNNQMTLSDFDKSSLSTQEIELVDLFIAQFGSDVLAMNRLLNTSNNELIFNLQLKSAEILVRVEQLIFNLQANSEVDNISHAQIINQINDLKNQRKKLVDHIQEQRDRKCPANLI